MNSNSMTIYGFVAEGSRGAAAVSRNFGDGHITCINGGYIGTWGNNEVDGITPYCLLPGLLPTY